MKNINQIVREKGDELLKKENVVGVGVGKKNGIGEESVVVMVKSKVSADELSEADLIPDHIDGAVTDVIEVGEITADSLPRNNKERPVYGGLSCIWERGTACTLGAIVYREGKAYALMNTHCVNPHWKGAEAGDEVRQPSPNDGGRNGDRIGVSTEDFHEIAFNGMDNPFDAGLCKLDEGIDALELKQEDLGEITPWPRHAERGEVVKKSGRTTGLTQTTVLLTNATVNVNYDGNIGRFTGQTIVENNNRHFGAGGDSSSLVVDKDNNPVGLYFAGSPTIGIYSPIKPILEKFNVAFTREPIPQPRYTFTRTLKLGDYGEEVVELQKRLREEGHFHYHTATGYFGTITEKAVQDYQCANDIVCSGDRFTTGWGQVGPKTRETLNNEKRPDMKPRPKQLMGQLVAIMEEIEPIIVTSSVRTNEEQQRLYEQGRTKPGKIVTNAKGGESMHNYGVAFDIAFVGNEVEELSADAMTGNIPQDIKEELESQGAIHYNGDWERVGKIGKVLGLDWGGDWTSFQDRPHFEYTAGHTLKDFQEGNVDEEKFNTCN